MDMAEVGLQTVARLMRQRDKALAGRSTSSPHIPAHLVIAALIPVLRLTETPVDLHRRVTLLRGCLLVGLENPVDHRVKRTELGRRPRLGQRVLMGLGLRKGSAHRSP